MDGWLCNVYTLKIAVMADVSWLRDCQVWLGIDGDQHSSREKPSWRGMAYLSSFDIALVLGALSLQSWSLGSDLIGLKESSSSYELELAFSQLSLSPAPDLSVSSALGQPWGLCDEEDGCKASPAA